MLDWPQLWLVHTRLHWQPILMSWMIWISSSFSIYLLHPCRSIPEPPTAWCWPTLLHWRDATGHFSSKCPHIKAKSFNLGFIEPHSDDPVSHGLGVLQVSFYKLQLVFEVSPRKSFCLDHKAQTGVVLMWQMTLWNLLTYAESWLFQTSSKWPPYTFILYTLLCSCFQDLLHSALLSQWRRANTILSFIWPKKLMDIHHRFL